jgi:ferredoxin-NADP reductase
LSDTKQAPPDWQGVLGHFTPQNVVQAVPDFSERTFYISGSHNMVVGFNEVLVSLDQPRSKIKTDFFPGLA